MLAANLKRLPCPHRALDWQPRLQSVGLDDLPSHPPSRKVHMTSDQYLTKSIRLTCDESLEEAWADANKPHGLAEANTGEKLPDPLVQNKAEEELTNALSRVALAANLLLMVYGSRRLDHENPSHANRLKRYVEVAKKRKG